MRSSKTILLATASFIFAASITENSASAAPISVTFSGMADYAAKISENYTTTQIPAGQAINFTLFFDTTNIYHQVSEYDPLSYVQNLTRVDAFSGSNSLSTAGGQTLTAGGLSVSDHSEGHTLEAWVGNSYYTYGPNGGAFEHRSSVNVFLHENITYSPDLLAVLLSAAADKTEFKFYAGTRVTDVSNYSSVYPAFDYKGAAFITSIAAVPEPMTLALLGVGLAGLGLARRSKAT